MFLMPHEVWITNVFRKLDDWSRLQLVSMCSDFIKNLKPHIYFTKLVGINSKKVMSQWYYPHLRSIRIFSPITFCPQVVTPCITKMVFDKIFSAELLAGQIPNTVIRL